MPPPRSKQSTRWAAKLRLKNVGEHENRRGRAIVDTLARRRYAIEAPHHPIVLVQRRDIDDAVHPIEHDPGAGSPEGAGEAPVVPQKPDRRKSRLERIPRRRGWFGEDSEEGGFAAFFEALADGQRLQRGVRLGIAA